MSPAVLASPSPAVSVFALFTLSTSRGTPTAPSLSTISQALCYCRRMADISTGWRVKDWRLGDPNANDLGSPWAQVGHDVDWPGYVFTVRFDGKLGVSGFDVDCKASGPLTAARLRKVPLGEIAATARTYMAAWWAEFDKGRTPEAHNAWPLPKVLSPQVDMRRRGRRGRPDSELAEIAAAYVRCCAEHPTRPMVALAKERGLDPSQLRGLLNQARNWNRGLLTEAPAGRAGGMLTDKAKALIPIRNAWNLA